MLITSARFVECLPKAKQSRWGGVQGWKNWRENDIASREENDVDGIVADDHIDDAEDDQNDSVDGGRPYGKLDGVRGSVADCREEEAIAHSNEPWKYILILL